MKYCLLLFLLLPAHAQLPPENSGLQKIKGLPINSAAIDLATALEVIYSTTDPARHQVFYEAVVKANRVVRHENLWAFFPDMEKDYKKNRALMVDDPYFKEAVSLNQALREAMKTNDPQQRQQNLHRLYSNAQYYTPTIVLIIETEWALGNHELGDQLLADLNILEPAHAVWPILILNAKKTRRTQGIEAGLDALKPAEKLSMINGNPVKKIRALWEAEIQNAGSPEKLAELGALKALSKWSKDHPKAAYHLAKLHLKQNQVQKALRSIKKAVSADKNNVDFFILETQIKQRVNSSKRKPPISKKALARIDQLQAKLPNHAKMYWLKAINYKADDAVRRENLLKAFELDPKDNDIYNSARTILTKMKANQDLINIFEKRLEIQPNLQTNLIYLKFLIQINEKDKALTQIERFLEQFPKNKFLYTIGSHRMNELAEDNLLKAHFTTRMLELIDHMIQTSDFKDAAQLVEKAQLIYPKRKELDVIQANIEFSLGNHEKAIELYEAILVDHPTHSALHELIGDSLLQLNKKRQARHAYHRALANKSRQKERLMSKVEFLEDQIKSGKAFDPVPKAFIQGVGGMDFASTKRFNRLGRALSTTAGGGWWGGSDIGGDAIRETSDLITPLYDYLLDLDLAWLDEQESE